MKNIPRLLTHLFCISSICIGVKSSAQSVEQYVVASAGSTAGLTGGSTLTFTVGESIISTAGTNPILSQGFNQPRLIDNPLPIKMTFSGVVEHDGNRLLWTTYQEMNSDFFNLESSIDGSKFTTVTKVKSKAPNGNSSMNIEYTYLDNSFMATKIYYRIKQVDKDGKFTYSNVVALENKNRAQATLSLFPNPAKSYIKIETPENGELSIIDVNGKVIMSLNVNMVTNIDLTSYTAGLYYIKFYGKNKSSSVSFVKE